MKLGIDIGTSYTSACILTPSGTAQPVDISTGESEFGTRYSMPTAVFAQDDGELLIGQAAVNSRRRNPACYRAEFKRNLGEGAPVLLGNSRFTVGQLYTKILRHITECVEKVSLEPVDEVVMTCPASYEQMRKDMLLEAAGNAGMFNVTLLDEPTAAAVCYRNLGYVHEGEKLLVYDFGGGTFDVSLVVLENGAFRNLSQPDGLEHCGGMDMDRKIEDDILETIRRSAPDGLSSLQEKSRRRLQVMVSDTAVRAKHSLSRQGSFDELFEVGIDDVEYTLSRDGFNAMAAPMVGETVRVCRNLLDSAGMDTDDVSAVLMVGGASRVPLVQDMVRNMAGKVPVLMAPDLELVVAQGAVHYNENIVGDDRKRGNVDSSDRELNYNKSKYSTCMGDTRFTNSMGMFDNGSGSELTTENLIIGTGNIGKDSKKLTIKPSSFKLSVGDYVNVDEDGTLKQYEVSSILRHGDQVGCAYVNDLYTFELKNECKKIIFHGYWYKNYKETLAPPVNKIELKSNIFIPRTFPLSLQDNDKEWHYFNRISAGRAHTIAIKNDGKVCAVGSNGYGQCNVDCLQSTIAVTASKLTWNNYTIVLQSNGKAVVVGGNSEGIYDEVNNKWNNIIEVSAYSHHAVGLMNDGRVVAAGSNSEKQCNVGNWKNIIAVSAGAWHTVGLKADGTVTAIGSNSEKQCNVGNWKNIVAISAGAWHTVGLKADGTVTATGNNSEKQCNVGNWKNIVAISAGEWYTVGLKADGTVVAAGDNGLGQCNVSNWKNIVAVSAGVWHTIGLKTDGTVVAVGDQSKERCDVGGWNLF